MKKLLMLVLVSIIVTGLSFAGSIIVNSPNGGEVWKRGVSKTISWNGSGLTNPVKITLWKNGVFVGLIVKNQPAANGTYSWTVGAYTGGTAACATDYKIKIREQGGPSFTTEDSSNANFKINGCGGGGRFTNRFRTPALNVNPSAIRKPNTPDLVITSIRQDPPNPSVGENWKFFISISNIGNAEAVFQRGSNVLYYTVSGTFRRKVPRISKVIIRPGGKIMVVLSAADITKIGKYPVLFKVDPDNIVKETNEGNNKRIITCTLISSKGKPDLIITSFKQDPPFPMEDEAWYFNVSVKNIGDIDAFIPNLYHSIADNSRGSFIGKTENRDITISPGRTYKFTTGHRSTKIGTWPVTIIVDPDNAVNETNENNNKKSGYYSIRRSKGRPDLVITKITTDIPMTTQGFFVYVTVKNRGLGFCDVYGRRVWIKTIKGEPFFSYSGGLGPSPGKSRTVKCWVSNPPAGQISWEVKVDPDRLLREADEKNNVKVLHLTVK